MIRDFVAGVIWGGVVAGVGLAVVSQVALPPVRQTEAAAPAAETDAETVMAGSEAPMADPLPAPEAKAPAADAPSTAAEPAVTAAPDDSPAEVAMPGESPAPAPQDTSPPVAPVEEPATPAAAAPAEVPVAQGADAAPLVEPPAPPAKEGVLAGLPEPAPAEPDEKLLQPLPEPLPETQPAAEPPAPEAPVAEAPAPEAPATEAPVAEAPAPEAPAAEAPAPQPPAPETATAEAPAESTLPPDDGLGNGAAGVTVGRLPSIAPESSDTLIETGVGTVTPAESATPLERFSRPFDAPVGKPLFAILLVDPGTAELDRAALAALPFPVTFVVDPFAPGAAEAVALYRAAGQEVAIFGVGIPQGAKAGDVEQTFAAHAAALPETVAVVDPGAGGFQNDRALSAALVDILKSQGRGLITFDQGLNAADQVARREDLPTATIFRSLDDDGEDTPVIRRYLDRAAFKAAQEGRVMVMGSARPETVAALLEWSVEGRASSVTLAPASALMIGD